MFSLNLSFQWSLHLFRSFGAWTIHQTLTTLNGRNQNQICTINHKKCTSLAKICPSSDSPSQKQNKEAGKLPVPWKQDLNYFMGQFTSVLFIRPRILNVFYHEDSRSFEGIVLQEFWEYSTPAALRVWYSRSFEGGCVVWSLHLLFMHIISFQYFASVHRTERIWTKTEFKGQAASGMWRLLLRFCHFLLYGKFELLYRKFKLLYRKFELLYRKFKLLYREF